MIAKSKSLTKQLALRLIILQALIILVFSVVLTFTVFSGNVSYIDEPVSHTILDAVHVNQSGNLELHADKKMQKLLRESPELWFVVEDAQGHRLEHGQVPEVYRPLLPSLYRLVPSEIHEGIAPYDLTMRVFVGPASTGSLRVICGGAPSTDMIAVFFGLLYYFGWRIILPMTLLTLIMVPWLIRRGMSGMAEVAAQAQAIDIDVQGARLADQAVPRELQPLVQAFNAALERLNEGYDARDRFLAGAAHELRAPIAILEARIETLESGATRTRLLADVARLSNLAEQLLDLQRLGKQQTAFEPLDLVALSREVTADVAPLVVDAGYELALDAPETHVMVMGDRQSLSRALTNLIQNAIAHGGGCGLITVDVKRDGTLGVSDQGPGIPAEERLRIFEPFYRLRPSSMGAGLGLHLVREIVALHGGWINVTEADGGGAYFRMRLTPVP
ncbi:sensor histidine kinase [Dyella caseinilytica]|uniref:histidine kinase n=1 Tax=Dyella caseinilytica TaxID=1849581 RepID=A0ABX7GTW4_9GAMM|nr:HAMP domain-containing sensor histidine kinase [Dyella caseinilytica]QRN53890.1 HAMP domain-containing histidine kinase [Dyella caseinilytica]GFZ89897.1 two-component sensor histidine kinase [Dyella caseinilytica]